MHYYKFIYGFFDSILKKKDLKMLKSDKIEDEYVLELKKRIEEILNKYNNRKADLKWADEEWEVGEIQEDLDRYAREIKKLKAKIKEYNHKS